MDLREAGTRHEPEAKMAYSIEESAAQIGVTRTMFYGLMRDGQIKTIKIGRRRLITRKELLRFLEEKVQEATA